MKNLLADIDGKSGKTPWQAYTVKHGIETLEVLVPLAKSGLFEDEMKKPLASKQAILEVLRTCGGELK